MSTALAVQNQQHPDQSKLELIKKTVAKGSTDLELELFMHACKRTGLDPLMKQIYAIKRGDAMSFQTGIDGYRLIADRTGQYAGSEEPTYMIGDDGYPDVASVTVIKLVGGQPCKFSASARWSEYVQNGRDGKPTAMWNKMPFLMLGKCAEALALRKAFPAELSGVYTHEEMMQADNEEPKVIPASQYGLNPRKQLDRAAPATPPAGEAVAAGEEPQGSSPAPMLTASMMSPQELREHIAKQPSAQAALTTFIWKMGKYKDYEVEKLPVDYLIWAMDNISRQDHKDAARAEIDRRHAQESMQMDGGAAE